MINANFDDASLEIKDHVIKFIKSYRQINSKDKEAGGMLIGSILVNSNVLTIRDYTPPLKGDYQSRYRFIRRKDSHNNLLYKKWKASNRTIMYIGEWHTHPEEDPYYSQQDIKNWITLLEKSTTFSNYLFFIIAGIKSYKIWVGDRRNKHIKLIYKGAYNENNTGSY